MDVVIARLHVRLLDQALEQRQGGLDAVDDEFVQRPPQPLQAFGPVRPCTISLPIRLS